MKAQPTPPKVSTGRAVTGIGGAAVTAASATAYLLAVSNPVVAIAGGVAGLGVVVYACVYAKKDAIITWPADETIDWNSNIKASSYLAKLNHDETKLTYTIDPDNGDVPLDAGTYTLTASAAETASYKPAVSQPFKLTIKKIKPTIVWSNAQIDAVYPARLSPADFNATVGGSPDNISYQRFGPNDTPAVGQYTLIATYTSPDKNHENAEARRRLDVTRGIVAVKWAPPDEIEYGETTIFNAIPTIDGGTLTYKNGHKTFDQSTDLNARDQPYDLTVEYKLPNYLPASAPARVKVKKAKFTIAWADPAAIEYGRQIGAGALNATPSVACKPNPVYRDTSQGNQGIQANSVLGGGPHVLEVTCEAIGTNYESPVKARATVQVNAATPVIDWTPPFEISEGRPIDVALYTGAAAKNPHNNQVAPGTFANRLPMPGTLSVLGPLTLVQDFVPANTPNHNAVNGVSRTIQVVRIAAREKIDAKISTAMEEKILTGQITASNTLIGAHSRGIIGNPDFLTAHIADNADGTQRYSVRKNLPGGGQTPAKTSTLPPGTWSNDDIMRATVDAANTPVLNTRASDGATEHRATTNGVAWVVVKDSTGNVTMSTPVGTGFTL